MNKEEFKWCPCGKPLNHKDKCLSVKFGEKRELIGKYSGPSKSINKYNDYR